MPGLTFPSHRRNVHTACQMRVNWRVAATTLVAPILLIGCSSPSPTTGVSYEQFRFTCCANSEALLQVWHPGQVITLQWTAETAGMTSDNAQHPITLATRVTGPYASVAALKAGGTHSETFIASPIQVTDRTSGSPVTTIALPLDLAAGWYNLVTTITSAAGSTGGASVIHVTRISS
jgi:hypothetical protein